MASSRLARVKARVAGQAAAPEAEPRVVVKVLVVRVLGLVLALRIPACRWAVRLLRDSRRHRPVQVGVARARR